MNRYEIAQIKRYVMTRIKAGKNIAVREVGGNIIIDAKGGGFGGGIAASPEPEVEYVLELPDVLTEPGYKAVFWCSEATGEAILDEPGLGDDQIWTNMYPQQRWYPQDRYTPRSGIPGLILGDDDEEEEEPGE